MQGSGALSAFPLFCTPKDAVLQKVPSIPQAPPWCPTPVLAVLCPVHAYLHGKMVCGSLSPGWDHVPFISLFPVCGTGLAEWALHKKEQASLVGGGAITSQAMTQFLRVAPPEHDGEALRPHISLQTAHRDHLTLWRASEEGASHLHFRDEETGVRVGWVTCPSTGLWGYWQSWDLNPGPGVGLH